MLSPDLFSIYTEMIMRSIADKEGIKVGGVNITNLRYADDTAIIADTEEKLQALLDIIVKESERMGLSINKKKTFSMVISKKEKPPTCRIKIQEERITCVNQFVYLGSMITSDGRSEKEIRRRIGIAKTAFKKMANVLASRNIRKETRIRILKCYIWSTLTYGCETWTISQKTQKQIEAVEMWFLRRMLKVPWVHRLTNREVLEKAETRSLMKAIIRRQIKFFGHAMRRESLQHLATTGKFDGKKARGRQRRTFLDEMGRFTGKTRIDLLQMSRNREVWRALAANVRI